MIIIKAKGGKIRLVVRYIFFFFSSQKARWRAGGRAEMTRENEVRPEGPTGHASYNKKMKRGAEWEEEVDDEEGGLAKKGREEGRAKRSWKVSEREAPVTSRIVSDWNFLSLSRFICRGFIVRLLDEYSIPSSPSFPLISRGRHPRIQHVFLRLFSPFLFLHLRPDSHFVFIIAPPSILAKARKSCQSADSWSKLRSLVSGFCRNRVCANRRGFLHPFVA